MEYGSVLDVLAPYGGFLAPVGERARVPDRVEPRDPEISPECEGSGLVWDGIKAKLNDARIVGFEPLIGRNLRAITPAGGRDRPWNQRVFPLNPPARQAWILGSRMSLNASPMRFHASTKRTIAPPGYSTVYQYLSGSPISPRSQLREKLTICPQSA